jgi:hypothetical protein
MARRRIRKEAGLEKTPPKVVDGLKAYLKKRQGWKTHYLRWSRALRRTQKEVGFENTLHKVVDGPKTHLKGGRVGKHTT